MRRMSLLFIGGLSLLGSICWGQEVKMARRIAKDIVKCQSDDLYQKGYGPRKVAYYLSKRKESINRLEWYKYIHFSLDRDTLYFLEGIENESLSTHYIIWNRNDTISFRNKVLLPLLPVENLVIELVGLWDITALKEISSKYAYLDGGLGTLDAARVIIKDKKLRVDCCKFEDFAPLYE